MAVEYEEIDLGPVDGIDGTNGREIELQATATYIQWRYVGETAWKNVIALSSIKGPQGIQGAVGKKIMLQATATYIQMKYDGDTTWTNLVALSSLKGQQGVPGPALSFKVGKVDTLAAGSQVKVTATVANNVVTLDIGIPQGDTGANGKDGNAKIANNLTTTDDTYALSALQGKILNLNKVQIGDIILSVALRNGWLECNGQAVSRTTYAELYAKIGTKYGAGNGATTFNVPSISPPLNYTIEGNGGVQLQTAIEGIKWYIKAKEVTS